MLSVVKGHKLTVVGNQQYDNVEKRKLPLALTFTVSHAV